LFAPLAGPDANLSFFETYFVCVAGALFSSCIFYFMSEIFLKKAAKKRTELRLGALEKGIELPRKNKFTKTNKFIVRMKMRFGIYGISMFAPLLLSIPLGTIVAAKFYGKERKTFFIIMLGIVLNGFLTTGLAFLIRG
jgi:hypothetical protein